MMNERLLEMQSRFSIQTLAQQEAQKKIMLRLRNYEKLKPSQYGLLDMTTDDIFEAISALEGDPQTVWNLIEKHYQKNFLEPIIVKRYTSLFTNNDEVYFEKTIKDLKE